MSNWKSVELGTMRGNAACYVVFGDGRLIYIGSTINMQSRFHQHNIVFARYSHSVDTPWGRFRDVTIKYRPSMKYGDWAMIELRLIRRLQPTGNKSGIISVA